MLALYRKYRPKSLSEVVGQSSVTDVLSNSIKNSKISHAYLFTGPRGTGKTSVARIFAHEINGFPYELEDSYVDIIEIDAASNTGVDNIRELREKACIAPTKGKYKVYIIDEVHMLSKSAFNALLKTLEEPPAHVVFILATTDIEKVPITITSRVQIHIFRLASPDTMLSHLKSICEKEKINIEDSALSLIVRRGGGSFRDSLSLLDQISALGKGEPITGALVESSLGLPQDELIHSLLSAYKSSDFATISNTLKDILNTGVKPETLAEALISTILSAPEPAFLPLLDRLPSVRGVFPEAKILLALTYSENTAPAPNIISTARSFSPKTSVSTPVNTTFSSKTEKTIEITKNSAKITEESAQKISETADFSSNFDYEAYFEAVKRASLGTAMWLKKSKNIFRAGTLHLYPETKAVKGILESANNRKVLVSCLSGGTLEIHEVGENPMNEAAKNDPTLSKINDIMGGLMEVKDGGELPF